MKVSDYMVSFLVEQGITDVFGYPGGMVTHLMDSFDKYSDKIKAHVSYHEQAAAFQACGYAQIRLLPGIAYATSGPGATNLITGIANAYFDSIPTIFITGQINTYESKSALSIRQRGFQEMDIVSIVEGITKYAICVSNAEEIAYCLEKAAYLCAEGRPGPVLLDIPMNIQRAEIDINSLKHYEPPQVEKFEFESFLSVLKESLQKSQRPCIIAGAGIQASGMGGIFRKITDAIKIPVVSSMLAIDLLPESSYYYGFIGSYGMRYANWIVKKSDLLIVLGSRLDLRQIGIDREHFAPEATIIRLDVDQNELNYKINRNEIQFWGDLQIVLPLLLGNISEISGDMFSEWNQTCGKIFQTLAGKDMLTPNVVVKKISLLMDEDSVITTDVGQNQVWVAQSFVSKGQRVIFSGGHGAMGYSLPAAIGAYYGSRKKVYCFTGDGGLQMNIQEMQFIAREDLPIKIILLNNRSLGMIRHFQEMYFDKNYVQTKEEKGYSIPDFEKISKAYAIPYKKMLQDDIASVEQFLKSDGPAFIEVILSETTYVSPKASVFKPLWDQEPPLDKDIVNELEKI